MNHFKNLNSDDPEANGFTLVSESEAFQMSPEEALTDEFCYFYHKGLYHAQWKYIHTDGRWWGKAEFGPFWFEKVKWHPKLKFRAEINRIFSWDLICEVDMKPGQVLNIWGTVFETAWNITTKDDLIAEINQARKLDTPFEQSAVIAR
ncbi:MAG: hypothetical protein EP338_11740 [Bacteroidetes bacterium]|nr:MAG: hypothetical protein EP338_11740 [Bacteroidota bacterium]